MSDTHIRTIESEVNLSVAAKTNIINWLTHDKFNSFKSELCEIIDAQEWKTLEDSFFRVIPFGTGGRRGTVGIGSNRINQVTLGEATQALCGYLAERESDAGHELKIAIAYDSRLTSLEFSQYIAGICAANGIQAYIFDDVRSTPQLSFTVRHLAADAGIVISASHNPSSDNGIKIYWEDGGQLVPPYDAELLAYAESVETINTMGYADGVAQQLIVELGEPEDNAYHQAVLDKSINPNNREAVVAFSPLHGAGYSNVRPVLEKAGFEVRILESQANYDGNFTNVTNNIPNPELPVASDKVIAYGLEQKCDMALTTDPDADRLGVVVLHADGTSSFLTGNQIAALLCHYILSMREKLGTLTGKQFVAKTIVTTDLIELIANDYGVQCRGNLLVGFKYIGELVRLYEDEGDEEFVFGGEESFGSLVGGYARDKDAAGAALLISELASVHKANGTTLVEQLDDLAVKYGAFQEELDSMTLKGADGFSIMKHVMNVLRSDEITQIGEFKVYKTRDYISGTEIKGRSEDVLRFEVSEDGHDRVTVRPSGTEPKLKIYTQVRVAPSGQTAHETKQQASDKAGRLRSAINSHVNGIIDQY